MCFLYEKRVEPSGTESTAWFCIRRYGGGICVVAADTIHRHVRGNGKICIFTGSNQELDNARKIYGQAVERIPTVGWFADALTRLIRGQLRGL